MANLGEIKAKITIDGNNFMLLRYVCWSASPLFNEGRFVATAFYDMSYSFSWKLPAQESMDRSNPFRSNMYNSRNWSNDI